MPVKAKRQKTIELPNYYRIFEVSTKDSSEASGEAVIREGINRFMRCKPPKVLKNRFASGAEELLVWNGGNAMAVIEIYIPLEADADTADNLIKKYFEYAEEYGKQKFKPYPITTRTRKFLNHGAVAPLFPSFMVTLAYDLGTHGEVLVIERKVKWQKKLLINIRWEFTKITEKRKVNKQS